MGLTHELAAAYGGVSDDSFMRWRKNNAAFADLIREAEAQAAFVWLSSIELAARQGEWTAAAWKLERRFPNGYGKRLPDLAADGELPLSRVVIVEDRRRALPSPGETTSDSDSDD